MRPSRPRAPRPAPVAVLCLVAALLLGGCGGDSDPGDPMGWIPERDEETDIRFALPPPSSGPEEERRPGRSTAVAARGYSARIGDLALAVQVLTTPEDPGAIGRERPPRRMPYVVIDEVRSAGAPEGDPAGDPESDYEIDVVDNERVDGLDHPAYDARLELSSSDEEAIWWLRSHELDDVVLVTQVVVFVEAGRREELEAQGATAFDRLNGTVEIPSGLTG